MAAPADVAFVGRRLRPHLTALLDQEAAAWKELGAPWQDPLGQLAGYLDGGKSLRPRFCFWGYAAAGGPAEPTAELLDACAAVELLHAFALIHDDLMDASDRRRGGPALHRSVAAEHARYGWRGSPGQYGTAAALLAGDLAFALANRLAAGLPGVTRPVWNQLITELVAGQFLDLAGAARGDRSAALASSVSRLKSGRYTVVGPLRLGAAVADPTGPGLPEPLLRYAELLGEAFQLRDDLLGAFGDPAVTGKPVGEDLRTGKPTALLAHAHHHATAPQRALLDRAGTDGLFDEDIAALTALLESTGARREVESRVRAAVTAALSDLDACALPAPVDAALRALATSATDRQA